MEVLTNQILGGKIGDSFRGHKGRNGHRGGSLPRGIQGTFVLKSGEKIKTLRIKGNGFLRKFKAIRGTQAPEQKWKVDDTHTARDYNKEAKCWILGDKAGSVAVKKDGDIISVCSGGKTKGMGAKLLEFAVAQGGNKLDSFDGNFGFYVKQGFEPISWTPFNREYAPKGWQEKYGEQHVIFFKYVGKENVSKEWLGDSEESLKLFYSKVKPFEGEDGYDNAMKFRDERM